MKIGVSGQPLAGILLIDKPSGMTSHDVINQIRRKTNVKRVGHAGTLDPLATGLLIVLVGREFTKQQSKFMKLKKEYVCEARLGLATDTYDIDGQVIQQRPWDQIKLITSDKLELVLKDFRGEITQTVPAYSAVKIKGEKLYRKARKGELDQTTLPKRRVIINNLEVLNFNLDNQQQELNFTIKTNVSSGTYIRSLVHDIGQALNLGATVIALRRTKIGDYDVARAQALESFKA